MKNRLLSLALVAIVCASSVSVEACDRCRSASTTTTTTSYAYFVRHYSYAYVDEPTYFVTYRFRGCDEDCCIPAPKPRCEVKELGLQRYDTNWCKCGCRREYVDKYGQTWRTDAEVKTLGSEIVGWRYDVVQADGTKDHFLREAKLVDGEWKAAGRLWHYAGDK